MMAVFSSLTGPFNYRGNFQGSCNSCVADDLTNVSDPENPVIGDITINLPAQGTNLTCSCREKDGDQRIGTSINLSKFRIVFPLCSLRTGDK